MTRISIGVCEGLVGLVVTALCVACSTADVGGKSIKPDTACATAGFTASATSFALPPGYSNPGGYVFATTDSDPQQDGASCNVGDIPEYALLDLTGDHLPDLVVTQDCNDASIGNARWAVYPNTGSGFAATAMSFALPPGYSNPGGYVFATTASNPEQGGASCNNGDIPFYSLLDLTGDGLPDLVVTQDCNDASIGNATWAVYPNTGTGFAATAIPFALPPGYSNPGGAVFATTAGSDPEGGPSCNNGNIPFYSLLDVTGDGNPDLVVSQDCNDDSIGNATWTVYPNTGTGFGAAIPFALPPGYSNPGGQVFGTMASDPEGGPSCDDRNIPFYTLLDVTGDGNPDLVISQDCNDDSIGNATWTVYPNTGTGFAATAIPFALPPGYSNPGGQVFGTTGSDPYGGASCNDRNIPFYSLLDLTHDGKTDLVVTQDCNDDSIGNATWTVYPNTGTGFAATAIPFALPPGYSNPGGHVFGTTSSNPEQDGASCNDIDIPFYSLHDLTGGGRDLVVTQDCNDASIGNTSWTVYAPAACD